MSLCENHIPINNKVAPMSTAIDMERAVLIDGRSVSETGVMVDMSMAERVAPTIIMTIMDAGGLLDQRNILSGSPDFLIANCARMVIVNIPIMLYAIAVYVVFRKVD